MQNRKSRVPGWMTTFRFLPAMVVIVACTPQDMPLPTRSAQFEKVGNRVFECQEFLPPDTTAFLILNYDGYPQDLPKSIMRMTSTKNTTGYRVDAELFFNVPQKQGPAVKVPVESKALDQALGALFQKMGGSPT